MREGLWLLVRRKVAAGKMRDRESASAQAFFREHDLTTLLERIFVAAAHQERNLAAICLVDAAEIEPASFGAVLRREAGGTIQEEELSAAQSAVDKSIILPLAVSSSLTTSRARSA